MQTAVCEMRVQDNACVFERTAVRKWRYDGFRCLWSRRRFLTLIVMLVCRCVRVSIVEKWVEMARAMPIYRGGVAEERFPVSGKVFVSPVRLTKIMMETRSVPAMHAAISHTSGLSGGTRSSIASCWLTRLRRPSLICFDDAAVMFLAAH